MKKGKMCLEMAGHNIMNIGKFTGKAGNYAKYRPTYPKEFIDYLYSEAGLSCNSVIADIGSGTGILSRELLNRGSTVFCVEPNEDMRKRAEEDLSEFHNFRSVDRSAEETALANDSMDYITAAQSFHWFDKEKFRLECQRILKKAGKVILVWNSRVEDSEMHRRNKKIIEKYCPGFRGFSGGFDENPDVFSQFYEGKYEIRIFTNNRRMDLAGFIGRNISSSYAPNPNDLNYNNFIEKLKELFELYNTNGYIILPYITKCYMGRV